MDAANAALALYLADRGCSVHLVGYQIEDQLLAHEGVTVHAVTRPLKSYFLGQRLLERAGHSVAASVRASHPDARVIVNGANCNIPDINWVHSVQHAWSSDVSDAPAWFRMKARIEKASVLALERKALRSARVIIANSEQTRRDVIECLGIAPERVRVIYLGSEPHWKLVNTEARCESRDRMHMAENRPLVAFVGALGHDNRKGFDILWKAWRNLCARPEWDADLIVAGGGRALKAWRYRVADAGLRHRIRFLGHVERISDVLAAADLLVSPVRYEPYGLNVHEALCCGVPAIVSSAAGVAERYPAELRDWLLPKPDCVEDLVARLSDWRRSPAAWKQRVRPMTQQLRERTWEDMAAEMFAIVSDTPSIAQGSRS